MATSGRGTRKKIGYVELEWVCPTCATRNPGSRKVCANCGAPQPDDVQFEQPLQASVVAAGDAAAAKVEATVAAGPDIHCPYCGARNAATNTSCVQCHAPLDKAVAREQGANLGAVQTAPLPEVPCHVCGARNPGAATTCTRCGSPLRRRNNTQTPGAPAPLPQPQRGGVALYWMIGGALLLIAVIGLIAWLGFRSESHTAIAQEARWQRSITVLGLVPVEREAWTDQLPADADVRSCRDVVRSTSPNPVPGGVEVCGEPYTVDTGTGYGEVFQDCEYQVYDKLCSYETLQWLPVDTLQSAGTGFTAAWPALGVAPDRQAGDRNERYQCVLAADGKSYSFDLTPDRYPLCQPGSAWNVKINGLGAIVSAEPAP